MLRFIGEVCKAKFIGESCTPISVSGAMWDNGISWDSGATWL